MPINDKQQAFVNEYITNGHNATQAYKKAYPDCKSGHKQAGSRLLTNVDIRQAIDTILDDIGAEAGWNVEIALSKLKDVIKKSMANKQYSSAVSGIVAANRMFCLDMDTQATDQPLPLTKEELDQANRAANVVLASQEAV
jgi:phage terminase small subunit